MENFEVLSEIDEKELAGEIAPGAAVVRRSPEQQLLSSYAMAAGAADLQGIHRSC